jgi:hypothetical protein
MRYRRTRANYERRLIHDAVNDHIDCALDFIRDVFAGQPVNRATLHDTLRLRTEVLINEIVPEQSEID